MGGKSTEEKLWCIKIESGAARLFKGGKKVDYFGELIGAEEEADITLSGTSDSVRSGRSPTSKKLKLEFIPSANGTFKFATVNPRYFNKFDCDGVFKKIESKTAENLAADINKALGDLETLNESQPADNTNQDVGNQPSQAQKRSLTSIFNEPSSAKKLKRGETGRVEDIERKCDECQLDNMVHYIPIEKLVLPPKKRQIREVDDCFLKQLINNIENQPSGSYEALFVVVKGIRNKEDFKTEKIAEYEFEVLGGTHVTLATKHLHTKYPNNPRFKGRVARIYVGLSDEEALWLGAMHNNTGSMRHRLTYKDEVEICRTQLFLPDVDCQGDPPSPSDAWRDVCASLLNKTKRNLSEIFTMAQLSGDGWIHFQSLNNLYERAELKGQKTKATDIVKKGKPVLKQWQLKPLCSLSPQDQTLLLQKVAKCEMSLEELKCAAGEIKLLKPVQEAIVSFFRAKTWEEVEAHFGSSVTAEKLLKFGGKDFEQSHDFQKFMAFLRRRRNGETAEVTDLINGQSGALGLIVCTKSLLDVEQPAVAKLPNFEGAFLAIGEAGENCKNASDVIAAVNRLNFTKLTAFNVVLFTPLDEVKNLKDKMVDEGATKAQAGHFYVQDRPQIERESEGPYLKEVLKTFVVGHWTVSRQISVRHLSVESNDNVVFVKHRPSEEPLPMEAYTWLVKHLSSQGDAVLDVGSSNGYSMVAALKEGRHAVWIRVASQDELSTLERKVLKLISNTSGIQEQNNRLYRSINDPVNHIQL